MEPTKVAILLACHNGAEWLDEQIESLLEQKNVDIEIYACDDRSTDDTLKILERYAESNINFHLIEFAEPAFGAARNFSRILYSIPIESFDFFAFCDQDDVWLPDKLSNAIFHLSQSGSDGYSAPVVVYRDKHPSGVLTQSSRTTAIDFLLEGAGQGCSYVFTRKLAISFLEALSLDQHWVQGDFYHDWAIYAVCRLCGYRWYFDKKPGLLYRQHESNDLGTKYSYRGILSRISKIRSGWYSKRIAHLCTLALLLAPHNGSVADFVKRYNKSRTSLFFRTSFAIYLLFNSRRKLSDRLALFTFELLGAVSKIEVVPPNEKPSSGRNR